MRLRGLEHRFGRGVAVEPLEEPAHLVLEPGGLWRFEVHALAADRAGHDLHRRGPVVTPHADVDRVHAAASGRKERRVPAEEPFFGQRPIETLGGVEHHFHHAFDVPVGRFQAADVDAETARERRAHLVGVEGLALDLAALQDVGGEREKNGSSSTLKPSAPIRPSRSPCLCLAVASCPAILL